MRIKVRRPRINLGLMSLVLAVFTFAVLPLHGSVKSDWTDATNANTIDAYDLFVKQHPKAKEVALARERIKDLKWRDTLKADAIEAYQAFVGEYPTDDHLQTATQRIAQLKAKKLSEDRWATAQHADTEEGYNENLRLEPSGSMAQQAKLGIEVLQDKASWQQAMQADTITAYRGYLAAHAKGLYRDNALAKIDRIDSELLPKYTQCVRSSGDPITRTRSGAYVDLRFGNDGTKRCDDQYPGYTCGFYFQAGGTYQIIRGSGDYPASITVPSNLAVTPLLGDCYRKTR